MTGKYWIAGTAMALALVVAPAAAQDNQPPVRYHLSFDNAAHHEAMIEVRFAALGDGPVRLRMSRSSPGRYAIHEFAKNVYDLRVSDEAGQPIGVRRDDPYSWIVDSHGESVIVRYRLYGNRADGTYAQIDPAHVHLNMPASMLWVEGLDDRAVELTFNLPSSDWKVATQLQPTDDPLTFRAPNLQYLMDSPVELSDHTTREWQVRQGDEVATIKLALHHQGSEEEVDHFAAMIRDVVAEHAAMWRDLPDFDFGEYVFLADYLPYVDGDGMEHRNSTVVSNTEGLKEANYGQISTVSHEFFHSWNVERMRPAELEPFDFTRANPTPSLWLAEGFTNYYGPLTTHRAGHSTLEKYLNTMAGQLNSVIDMPGRHGSSPQEMSLRAPFMDAATSIDPNNFSNVMVSYYPYGASIAIGLDMELRGRSPAVTLDDFMRAMWQRFGATETPYTQADVEQVLGEVSDPAFAKAFFDRYIRSGDLPDYAPLLAQAGILYRVKNPDKASLGPAQFDYGEDGATLTSSSRIGSPLYVAGIDRDDRILSVGDVAIRSKEDWNGLSGRFHPGDKVTIHYVQRGMEKSAEAIFASDTKIELVPFEAADMTPNEEQLAFRTAWLASNRKN